MRSTPETFDAASPLSLRRAAAKARERRTDYLARAYRCGDMAVRARNAEDAEFLRAMTLVWQVLAEKNADAHKSAAAPTPSTSLKLHHPQGGRHEDSGIGADTCDGSYGFGAGAAAAAKRYAGIEEASMLRILPDASWHAARDHPLYADQCSLLAPLSRAF